MKLVIDTNVLISAVVKDSLTRKILLSPYFEFYIPDFAIIELRKHYDLLKKKTGLDREKLDEIIDLINESVHIVSSVKFEKYMPMAFGEMKKIDISDSPFLALALSFSNDGIWSDDKHLQKQSLVRTWKTSEMLETLKKHGIE